ncbi:hypothetical protein SEUCBS140593_001625 [Sporothrix eucalyptigena]|uniref:Xylanolytic transcriptional activator regulatory domain-containing protein n=1 Tax=Sporothrix eucalyptigena TaxID=1812306 RepID=A0ABP0AZS7_9PEZI
MSNHGDDEDVTQPASQADQGPPKKRKTLACKRCRQRKQKVLPALRVLCGVPLLTQSLHFPRHQCTEVRPCENCTQSGAECFPSEAAVATKPTLELDYVQRLEERVAQLETLIPQESIDHINVTFGQVAPSTQLEVRPEMRPEVNIRPVSSVRPPPFVPTPAPPPSHYRARLDNMDSMPAAPEAPLDMLSRSLFGAVTSITSIAHNYPPAEQSDEAPPTEVPYLAPELKRFLIHTYFDMAQSQYPVLLRHEFLDWAETWASVSDAQQAQNAQNESAQWKGFFVYMVYAIAFLMTKSRVNGPMRAKDFHTLATTCYLPCVVDAPDPLLRAQAYLLLTMYALHMPSRDRIIVLSSRAIRFCIEAQLHLVEAEPEPAPESATAAATAEALVQIQHRRRIFWCAYAMDRVVCGAHDLPASVADHHITVPLFENIDDDQLQTMAAWAATAQQPLVGSSTPTNVSSALHVIAGRQIESEIQDMLLRRDYDASSRTAAAWRARMLSHLKAWNAQSRGAVTSLERDEVAKPAGTGTLGGSGYASLRWHKMIYYYDIVMLYRPTRRLASSLAGDLVVQASCQALLLFRRFQMAREIAQPWLGLLTQFQIGVALLYCFFATPPSRWPASFCSTDVPDAIRACSSTLAVLAERWPAAEGLRDVLEVLASEVPLGATWARPARISASACAAIEAAWPRLVRIVLDRHTLNLVREMSAEPFVDEAELEDMHGHGDAHRTHNGNPTVDGPHSAPSHVSDGAGSDIFDGMDLQWAHLAHASTLEMDPRLYMTSDTNTCLEDIDLIM